MKQIITAGLFLAFSSLPAMAGEAIPVAEVVLPNGHAFLLKKDFKAEGCSFYEGGRVTIGAVQEGFRRQVEYNPPSMFTNDCALGRYSVTESDLLAAYFESEPEAKKNYGSPLSRDAFGRAQRPATVRENDVVQLNIAASSTSDYVWASRGKSNAKCKFKQGQVQVLSQDDGNIQVALKTSGGIILDGMACDKGAILSLTPLEFRSYFQRIYHTDRPMREGDGCYVAKEGVTYSTCQQNFMGEVMKAKAFQEACEKLNRIYHFGNIENASSGEISVRYPGVSTSAAQMGFNLVEISGCGNPKKLLAALDAKKKICLEQIRVKCPGEQEAKVPAESKPQLPATKTEQPEDPVSRGSQLMILD